MIRSIIQIDSLSSISIADSTGFLPPIYFWNDNISESNKIDFFQNFQHKFILEISWKGGDIQELIQDKLPYLFHKNYFFINSRPLLKFDGNITSTELATLIEEFVAHGYEPIIFQVNNEGKYQFININDEFIQKSRIISAQEWDQESIIDVLTTQFIFCQLNDLRLLTEKIETELNSNKKLAMMFDKYEKSKIKNELLLDKLNWSESQLINHKMYLSIMKGRVDELQSFGKIYSKFVSLLSRAGFLRKIAKTFYNLIIKKRK